MFEQIDDLYQFLTQAVEATSSFAARLKALCASRPADQRAAMGFIPSWEGDRALWR